MMSKQLGSGQDQTQMQTLVTQPQKDWLLTIPRTRTKTYAHLKGYGLKHNVGGGVAIQEDQWPASDNPGGLSAGYK